MIDDSEEVAEAFKKMVAHPNMEILPAGKFTYFHLLPPFLC
jgi:hypothetical protein